MDAVNGRDKRRFDRSFCNIKITYTVLSSNDAAPSEYGATRSRDLSEGGVCILTDRPVAVPILMQLNLCIPIRPFHLLVLGKTVRCRLTEEGLYDVGIKFVGILPPNFKQLLVDYITPETPRLEGVLAPPPPA